MADLMTGTYSTENLRRDNGGFMIPDFPLKQMENRSDGLQRAGRFLLIPFN